MKILKETEKYVLFERTSRSSGCFRIERKADEAFTICNFGSEGEEWAKKLGSMNNPDFDLQIESTEFFT